MSDPWPAREAIRLAIESMELGTKIGILSAVGAVRGEFVERTGERGAFARSESTSEISPILLILASFGDRGEL
jgi:hypothetical protein